MRTGAQGHHPRVLGVRILGTACVLVFVCTYFLSSVEAPQHLKHILRSRDGALARETRAGRGPTKTRALLDLEYLRGDAEGEVAPTCPNGSHLYERVRGTCDGLFLVGDALGLFEEKQQVGSCPTEREGRKLYWAAIALLMTGIVLVLMFMAVIADAFFCPCVSELTEQLSIPPVVAGVTLLPLGNGSPDVFSAVIAAVKGAGEIGAGAIGGAGLFVVTIVLGTVFIVAEPFRLARRSFTRDCIFFFSVCAYYILVTFSGVKSATSGLLLVSVFPLTYVVYIAIVVYNELIRKDMESTMAIGTPGMNSAEQPLLRGEDEEMDDDDRGDGYNESRTTRSNSLFHKHFGGQGDDGGSEPSYSVVDFYYRAVKLKSELIHFNTDTVRDDGGRKDPPRTIEAPAILVQHDEQEQEEEERKMIRARSRRRSISFDAGSGSLLRDIEEARSQSSLVAPSIPVIPLQGSPRTGEDAREEGGKQRAALRRSKTNVGSAGRRSLMPDDVRQFSFEYEPVSPVQDPCSTSTTSDVGSEIQISELPSHRGEETSGMMPPSFCCSPERGPSSDGHESGGRSPLSFAHRFLQYLLVGLEYLWSAFEFPIYWMIAFIVPQPVPSKFSLWVAAVNVFAYPCLMSAFIGNTIGTEDPAPYILPIALASAPCALAAYFLLRRAITDAGGGDVDHADVNDILRLPRLQLGMTGLSFFSCIFIMSLTADKLVDFLDAFGSLVGIDSFSVGMTILAWGNSAADFLTDVSIGKLPGAAPTAVAGAISGPFFNMCIGFGISLCIQANRAIATGAAFVVPGGDLTGRALYALLALAVLFVWQSVAWNGYIPKKESGVVLFVVYIVSVLCVLSLNTI